MPEPRPIRQPLRDEQGLLGIVGKIAAAPPDEPPGAQPLPERLVALREGILYVRVLQPALHYELEQISKIDILRKLKQRFGGKVIRDIRFRVG